MIAAPACPSDDDLTAFLAGHLEPSIATAIRAHLPTCSDCTLVVEASGEAGTLPQAAGQGPARAGALVGTYVLQRQIGEGGMGVVWEAYDPELDRMVALKLMRERDPQLARRFAREMRITARLQHPAIVAIFDAGVHAGSNPYYVMRRISGSSLAALVTARPGWAAREELLGIVLAAIEAVAYAHRANVIHRDLKLENILVGEHGEAVVIDWGLAKALDEPSTGDADDPLRASRASGATLAGSVLGTPAYMPPEQARGEAVDATADVYSLGAILYAVATAHRPYAEHAASAVIDAVIAGPPSPVPVEVAPALATIINRAMAREPAARYASAAALAEELRRFVAGDRVVGHRYPARALARRWLGRHRAAVAVGVVAVIASAIVVAAVAARGAHGARSLGAAAVGAAEPRRTPGFADNQQPIVVGEAVTQPTLSADGTLLAYATETGFAIRTLATGETHTHDATARVAHLRWAPHANLLALATEAGPQFVDATGTAIRAFEAAGVMCRIAWSPDASAVLWHCLGDPEWTIFDVATGAKRPRPLEIPNDTVVSLDWGPRGLAVGTMGPQTASLWVLPFEGRAPIHVADERMVSSVQWSHDGTRVFYARPREPGSEIVSRDPAEPSAAPQVALGLPQSEIAVGTMFSFSADEQSLIVYRQQHLSDVARQAFDGTPPSLLTTDHQRKTFAAVARDASSVVFVSQVDDQRRIYQLPLPSGPLTELGEPGDHGSVAYSPDGTQLALYETEPDGRPVVRVMELATRAVRTFPVPKSSTAYLEWLDGASIVVAPRATSDLLVVDARSGLTRALLPHEPRAELFRAALDHDGTQLASLIVPTPGASLLVVIDVATGRERVVMPRSRASPIGWSEDHTWIYALEQPADDARVRVIAIRADGSGQTRLLAVAPAGDSVRVLAHEAGLVYVMGTVTTELWLATATPRTDVARGAPVAAPAPLAKLAAPTNLALVGPVGDGPPSWERLGTPVAPAITSECGGPASCVVLDGASEGELLQRIDATPYRGHRIRVAAAARVQSGTLAIGVNTVIYSRSYLPGGRADFANEAWARDEVTADIAPDAIAIEVKLRAAGSGHAWVRDVSIEVVK